MAKKTKDEKKLDRVIKLEQATAAISVIWTTLIAATILTWMGRHFIHYGTLSQVKLIFACMGIVIGALLVLSMGIYEAYYAIAEGISKGSSIALGIWFIIITGVLPGIMYFVCLGYDKHVPIYAYSGTGTNINTGGTSGKKTTTKKTTSGTTTKKTTVATTKKPTTVTKTKKDPRKYFVEDEDDVGLVPEIKTVKFEDLEAAVDEDDK